MSAAVSSVDRVEMLRPSGALRADTIELTRRLVSADDWDAIISGFDTVCQEQIFAFAQLRWPSVTLEPNLFYVSNVPVGGVLIMIQRLPGGLSSIAIAKWAPMIADTQHPEADAIYNAMVAALKAEYADKRGMLVSILPHASTDPHNADYAALRGAGFKRGYALTYPDRYLVKLQLSEAELRASFDQTWRRQLTKSEKNNLRFEHAPPEQLGAFKLLYAAMSERKLFPDFSAFDTLDKLFVLDPTLRPELFYVYEGDALVAGAVIFKAGKRAVYLYGATNAAALPLRAGYFLHFHIIQWLSQSTDAEWYDLGGTDGFLGLHQFKKGMVGSRGVITPVPPVVNYASNPLAYALGVGALGAREMLHRLRRTLSRANRNIAQSDQPLPPLDRQFS
ncbi:peptidoglycan bridge formation glycyltransferase FemA/FemB family protein [Devosia sp. MC532]|uniref:lipid II:glycine glycyltransferase FemX n=1 Tax=Devosia sp. MC532 TaxID=2799788 RepID=UPI0018F5069E|nr:peptidoglycan bridge formation glycyltransferase FemA/FemB family protein [Devosia sp. MC532]MBJ7577077.1 peptidoglycan bridge formation glycyltransferase FemA/FemB family protein [Devosia sp. MC532]